MIATVRLDDNLEKTLNRVSKIVQKKKSDVIREAIIFYSQNIEQNKKSRILKAIEKTKDIMERSTPKIRFEIGKRIRLRLTPELRFVYSNGLEEGSRVTELIDKISRGEIK